MDRHDQPGGGEHGVAPLRHRRGPGVVLEPLDPRFEAVDADDAVHDPDPAALAVQIAALLHMEFEQGAHPSRVEGRAVQPAGGRVRSARAIRGG